MRWLTLVSMVWWACGCGGKAIVDPTASQEYAVGCNGDGFYPEGPYGLAVNSTLEDYTLTAAVAGNLETVSMCDFYNPIGDAALPEVLMIHITSTWVHTVPHQEDVIGTFLELQPLGAELVVVLSEGNEQGVPADSYDLQLWIEAFGDDVIIAIDPSGTIQTDIPNPAALPMSVLIDTTTMRIEQGVAGFPSDGFWASLKDMLADP